MKKIIFAVLLFSAQFGLAQMPGTFPSIAERGMICPTQNGLAKAWWQRANDLFAGGDAEAAASFFKKSMETDSSFCDPIYGLSILYFAWGKLDSAEVFARLSFSKNPVSEKLGFNLASVLAARTKFQDAIPLLEGLSKTDFKKAETLQLLAQMYLFAEFFEKSVAAANASLAICESADPQLAGLDYLILGSNWLWQMQPEKARPLFEKAQSLGANVPESYKKAAGMN